MQFLSKLTDRQKLWLIVLAVVLFILFVAIALAWVGRDDDASFGDGAITVPGTPEFPISSSAPLPTSSAVQPSPAAAPDAPPAVAPTTVAITTRARIFAERFGTFSSHNDFQNIEELRPMMTATMQREADLLVASGRIERGDDAIYAGTTTRALNVEVIGVDEAAGVARVSVTTQRETSREGAPDTVEYVRLVLSLRNSDADWKVDTASWQAVP